MGTKNRLADIDRTNRREVKQFVDEVNAIDAEISVRMREDKDPLHIMALRTLRDSEIGLSDEQRQVLSDHESRIRFDNASDVERSLIGAVRRVLPPSHGQGADGLTRLLDVVDALRAAVAEWTTSDSPDTT